MDDFKKCSKCPPEDHVDWACRCEDRNIRVAKERRKKGISAMVVAMHQILNLLMMTA